MEINKRSVEIINADNGYVIVERIIDHAEDDPSKVIRTDEITVVEDQDDDKKTLSTLLFIVAEKFGYSYDKFGKENLNITFDKPGHKVDEDDR